MLKECRVSNYSPGTGGPREGGGAMFKGWCWQATQGDSIVFEPTEEEGQQVLALCNHYVKVDTNV